MFLGVQIGQAKKNLSLESRIMNTESHVNALFPLGDLHCRWPRVRDSIVLDISADHQLLDTTQPTGQSFPQFGYDTADD